MHAAKHFSLGWVKFNSRPFSDFSYSDADYPQVLITSDFANTNTTIELTEMLRTRKGTEYINFWSVITLVSAIASDSLEREYENSNLLDYLLENYYNEEEQGHLLDDILVFVPRYQQLYPALLCDRLPIAIKKRIALLIANGRVHALNITDVFSEYYPVMKTFFDNDDTEQTLVKLLGWKRHTSGDDISEWDRESILDCLTYNETWCNFIISWFDSEDNDVNFWKGQFLNSPPL